MLIFNGITNASPLITAVFYNHSRDTFINTLREYMNDPSGRTALIDMGFQFPVTKDLVSFVPSIGVLDYIIKDSIDAGPTVEDLVHYFRNENIIIPIRKDYQKLLSCVPYFLTDGTVNALSNIIKKLIKDLLSIRKRVCSVILAPDPGVIGTPCVARSIAHNIEIVDTDFYMEDFLNC